MNPPRPTHWQLRTRRLELPWPGGLVRRPLVMGIVNVTPDSFSDGGRHADVEAAVAHGLALAAEGADILDVGGESTRPFSEPVAEAEELARVAEVVRRLSAESGLPVSIDTSKAAVAARAVELGAEIINDVTGLEGDPRMLTVARESAAGVCAMHMRGTPQTMQLDPRYDDVVAEIHAYLRQRRDALVAAGISLDRICLDPGIGFSKTHAHNLELMAEAGRFLDLGCPVLVGHSRKGFIGKHLETALGRPATEADRDAGTAGAACGLAAAGVQIVRVHAVALVRAALELFAATRPRPAAGLATHWNDIFASKDDPQLGWYETDLSQTFKLLDLVPGLAGATIVLPGAGTSRLVDELLARGARLVVNDISDEALRKLQARLGEREQQPVWLHHDIAQPLPSGLPACDVWIDRAVLHFLLEERAIDGYFRNLRSSLRPGGHVLLAEFAVGGAPKCAGLEVHRYTVAEMAERLGAGFELVQADDYTFVNPAGDPRPYVYALFRRNA